MALPKPVQRLESEANAAIEAIKAEQSAQAENVVTDASKLVVVKNEQTEAEPQPAASSQAAPSPVQAPSQAPNDFEQRWRTLQGKYNAEVPRLTKALQDAQQQIALLNEKLQQLSESKKTEKASEPVSPAADPKDIENFGADLVDMVNRQAQRVYAALADQFGKKVAEYEARLKAVEQQLSGVSQRAETTLEQQFWSTLSSLVPDWETINVDERWLKWLSEVDPVYGVPRQAALDAAHKALDAQRVANVFKTFKATLPAQQVDSLSSQVAPSGAASSAPPATQSKPVISSKAVERFYKDVALGKYAGREQEVQRIEAEINAAAAEGRIQ